MSGDDASTAKLTADIATLLKQRFHAADRVDVEGVAPMFGGNARLAWSFAARVVDGESSRRLDCVMLSQGAGRQIDTSVEQEYRVLEGLNGKGTRAPEAVAMDPAGACIGAPSIVLARLTGEANAVKFLRSQDMEGARALCIDLVHAVAELHAVSWDPPAFDRRLHGLSAREIAMLQVRHWSDTFEAQRMEPLPELAEVFAWLGANLPDPSAIRLVHGDLRAGNFLYAGQRVTGLLDWEMAHLGDPLEDIGWIYRPMWSPKRFVPLEEFVDLYAQLTHRDVRWQDVLCYRVFSEAKFAVISLTASRSFSEGRTRNLRHADRAVKVAPCVKLCHDLIERHEAAGVHHV